MKTKDRYRYWTAPEIFKEIQKKGKKLAEELSDEDRVTISREIDTLWKELERRR